MIVGLKCWIRIQIKLIRIRTLLKLEGKGGISEIFCGFSLSVAGVNLKCLSPEYTEEVPRVGYLPRLAHLFPIIIKTTVEKCRRRMLQKYETTRFSM